jgi:micrococcal nuclease
MSMMITVHIFGRVLICLLLLSSTSFVDLIGQVIAVLDGDTIEVLHNTRAERIRLNGIDCPEKGHAYGKRANQAASALVFCREVVLQTHGVYKNGRTIADILHA